MKKSIKVLLIIALFAIGIENVYAKKYTLNVNPNTSRSTVGIKTNTTAGLFGSDQIYYPSFLVVKDAAGELATSFCRNPGKSAGVQGTNINYTDALVTYKNKITKSELKKTSTSRSNSFFAGIKYILNEGFDGTTLSNKSDSIDFIATQQALRFYEMIWKSYNTNPWSISDTLPNLALYADEYLNAHYNYFNNNILKTNNFLSANAKNKLESIDEKYSTVLFSEIINEESEKYKTSDLYSSANIIGYTDGTNDVTSIVNSKISDYLEGAVNASYNASINGVATIGYKNSMPQSIQSDGTSQYKDIHYQIAKINFMDSPEIYASVELKNSVYTQGNIVAQLYVNNTSSENLIYSTDPTDVTSERNLINDFSNDSDGYGTMKLIVRLKTVGEEYICENVKYKVILKYNDGTILEDPLKNNGQSSTGSSIQATYVQNNNGSATSTDKYHELVITDPDGDGWDQQKLCIGEDDCRFIKESCEGTYEEDEDILACQIFANTYHNKCAVCTLDAILPSCTNVDTELLLNEGTAYEEISENVLDCGSAKDSVLDCVIKGKDPAENSYKAEGLVSDSNPYCQVYCKEDYHIGLPGIQTANAGRSFQLNASITGGKTCYTGKINKEKLKNDLNSYKSTIASGDPVAASEASIKYNNAINQYKECFNWNMTYNYNPEIKFEYNETYFDLIKNNKNTFTAFDLETNKSIDTVAPSAVKSYFYFSNSIQDDYCKNSVDGDCAFKSNIADVSKISLTLNDGTVVTNIPSATYVKQESTVNAAYATPDHFYAVTSYRTIAVPQSDAPDEHASLQLENQLPVAHNTTIGTYDYSIKINNLGEYYNSDDGVHTKESLGRIWGDQNSVVNVVTSNIEVDNNVHTQCSKNQINEEYDGESVDLVEQDSTTTLNNGVYVCKYQVNENECRIDKDKDGNPVYYLNDVIVSKETYYSQCPGDDICKKTCTYDRDNNLYYGSSGTIVDINTFKSQCNDNRPHMCKEEPAGSGNYFGINGEKVSKEQYLRECNACKKEPDGAGFKYTGIDGNSVSESVYNEQCPKRCQIIGGTHYYYGEVVSQETYNSCCDPCPDCDEEGGGLDLDDGDCEGPHCIPTGGGLSGLNVNFRPVTNQNINPNNRPLGNNWEVKNPEITLHPDEHQSELQQEEYALTSALELKAIVATKEIQEDGELIYDTSKEDNQTLTVTLNQALLRKIVAMNDDARENEGGYTNNTLVCYDHKIGEKVYKNVFCYSTFLDALITAHPDLFTFTIPDGGSRYQTDGERQNSMTSKYWKPWTEVDTSSWAVMTNYDMVSTFDGFGTTLNIGPSWK